MTEYTCDFQVAGAINELLIELKRIANALEKSVEIAQKTLDRINEIK